MKWKLKSSTVALQEVCDFFTFGWLFSTSVPLNSHFTVCVHRCFVHTEQLNVTLSASLCSVAEGDTKRTQLLDYNYNYYNNWVYNMKQLLTGNKWQIVLIVLTSSWFGLSAGVASHVLHCDLLYNQRTFLCNSVQFRFIIFTALPLTHHLHRFCGSGISEVPDGTVTFSLTVFHLSTG